MSWLSYPALWRCAVLEGGKLEKAVDMLRIVGKLGVRTSQWGTDGGGVAMQPRIDMEEVLTLYPSLTRELEKKLSDKTVIFLSQRRVLPKPKRNSAAAHKQKRPRSRTLGAVHEKILDDLVWPSEITGKRTRVAEDGGKLIRVYLDPKDQAQLEYKLDTFSSVYRQLAGKEVHFE